MITAEANVYNTLKRKLKISKCPSDVKTDCQHIRPSWCRACPGSPDQNLACAMKYHCLSVLRRTLRRECGSVRIHNLISFMALLFTYMYILSVTLCTYFRYVKSYLTWCIMYYSWEFLDALFEKSTLVSFVINRRLCWMCLYLHTHFASYLCIKFSILKATETAQYMYYVQSVSPSRLCPADYTSSYSPIAVKDVSPSKGLVLDLAFGNISGR
jgi:hypothetical protein